MTYSAAYRNKWIGRKREQRAARLIGSDLADQVRLQREQWDSDKPDDRTRIDGEKGKGCNGTEWG